MRNISLILFAVVAVSLTGFLFAFRENPESNTQNAVSLRDAEIIVYQSPTCGCCHNYVSYLKERGATVTIEKTEAMGEIKARHNVPASLESCHTSLVGGYVVEGHVPAEAMRKLLDEKPTIIGISLPEMPSGSPGMEGEKVAPFRIHSITSDGKDGGIFAEI